LGRVQLRAKARCLGGLPRQLGGLPLDGGDLCASGRMCTCPPCTAVALTSVSPPVLFATVRPVSPSASAEPEEVEAGDAGAAAPAAAAATTAVALPGGEGDDEDGDGVTLEFSREEADSYDDMLSRVFTLLYANNPELTDRTRKKVKPPQVMRVGTTRTAWVNFKEICGAYPARLRA
jgi:hypothetical protein